MQLPSDARWRRMQTAIAVLGSGPRRADAYWLFLAMTVLEIMLWIASVQAPPSWWHAGALAWHEDPRLLGMWIAAGAAAVMFVYAFLLGQVVPRQGAESGRVVATLIITVAAVWLVGGLEHADPVWMLTMLAVPVLCGLLSRRDPVAVPALRLPLWGGLLMLALVPIARSVAHGQHDFYGSWVTVAYTVGLGLMANWFGWSAVDGTVQRRLEWRQREAQRHGTAEGREDVVRDPAAFDHLVGLDRAVTAIKDAVEVPLLYPERVREYRLKPTKGILLVGPPGTGKTALARASAAYCGCAFRAVTQTDLTHGIVGGSEAKVRELFAWARQKAPAIIFIDEIDAIGGRRDGSSLNRPSDLILRCLLAEMDGFQPLTGVLILAATNHADLLDPALRRPGRFDQEIEIGLPDEEGRRRIWEVLLKDRPLAVGVDAAALAAATAGWTPAEIEGATNAAALQALKRNSNILMVDLIRSVEQRAQRYAQL